MQKLTLNIVYSVTLSVYQHRAEIELTTFGMLAQCSANRATGSDQLSSSMNPFTSFDIGVILYVVIILMWCIYSGESYVCAGNGNSAVVRHIFSLTGLDINSVRVTTETSFSLEYIKPRHIKIMMTSNITHYTSWIFPPSEVGQQKRKTS